MTSRSTTAIPATSLADANGSENTQLKERVKELEIELTDVQSALEANWVTHQTVIAENARLREALGKIAGLTIVVDSHADCGNVAMCAIEIASEALKERL